MKEYNLSQNELHLIVLGSLYNGLAVQDNYVITSLDVKKYLREIRGVRVTQATVSAALDELYTWWEEEGIVLEVGDDVYDLVYKIASRDGKSFRQYYLEKIIIEPEEESIIDDNDDDKTYGEIICDVIMQYPTFNSQDIVDILIANYKDKLNPIPSVQSVAAYKAAISRRN